ncbi:MAG: ankyrin repeat domain-containing protein [Candidatus Riflebacteria bacterium]|nr:ankyrin repeat domain-containing protein [Candidatus Riflebacteria bacterium]
MARKPPGLPPLLEGFYMAFVAFWVCLFTYPIFWHISTPDYVFSRYHLWRQNSKLVDDKVYPFADLLHMVRYPVHNATFKGKPERIAKLKPEAGVYNQLDFFAFTPLAYAAFNADHVMLQTIIETGADPNIMLAKNMTALHFAAINSDEKAALMLLQHKARPDIQDLNGTTPLHIFIQHSMKDSFMASLQTDFTIDHPDSDGLTPLDYAIRQNSLEYVSELARAGAKPKFSQTTKNFQITVFLAQWKKTGDYHQAMEFVRNSAAKSYKKDPYTGLPAEFPVDKTTETSKKKPGAFIPDEDL